MDNSPSRSDVLVKLAGGEAEDAVLAMAVFNLTAELRKSG